LENALNVNSRSTKILVVDDEAAMREVLEMRLQEWGFEVCLAGDGAEGKEMAESYDPDIVISDVIMPQVSGMELLRALRAGDPDRLRSSVPKRRGFCPRRNRVRAVLEGMPRDGPSRAARRREGSVFAISCGRNNTLRRP